ncbi:MAG: 1-(5-phosphoribosyl)-5-[(5-phosphoribosylamino)methylideneamino]imidazole-4-carboxamide isomerase [Anaerolineae bacterium]|nr:1-(5-phosphoribosyl)-5-[(5-phosphoribosylamino)methylideneamino]imidazole-4-carboxamide isomerase [Anaerolineae bacterium]
MNTFIIYPAIDLRGGRVVRLQQGDPGRETQYNTDPLAVAQQWQDAGATWVHVVNLDGAFGETGQANSKALSRILTTGLSVQFGGGLRDSDSIRRALESGVSRVVLGTIAVENPKLVGTALTDFGPDRVAVGIDALEGIVQVRGWQEAALLKAADLARQWAAMGGRWLIFTDVSRDGMGSGVNVAATRSLAQNTGLNVIASGGVACLNDVQRARDAGLRGVIIGRALYEGQVDLAQAIRMMNDE